jgi:hypothetical protein
MRSLLTGYAGAFNRRHKRVGHLFQNRYKSVVVDEESYLLELVRYLHLNPLRANVIPKLRTLDRYPWTGHSALIGTVARPWQATQEVLAQFGPRLGRARRAYRDFVAAGISRGRRAELQGGGLIRSAGGWAAVAALRRGREAFLADERILGDSEFVETVRAHLQASAPAATARPRPLPEIVTRVCAATGCSPAALAQGSRLALVARAREGVAYLSIEVAGYTGKTVAEHLGVGLPSVYRAAQRGRLAGNRWDAVFRKCSK